MASGGTSGGGFKLASAVVEVRADQRQLDRDLAAIRRKVSAATSMVGLGSGYGITRSVAAFGTAGLAIFGVTRALEASVGAAMQSERVNVKLAAALRESGGAALSGANDVNAFARTMADLYGVEQDATKQAMALGLNLGINKGQIEGFTQVAIGLSAATGENLTSAVEQLDKALHANFMTLQRHFPQLAQYHTAQEKLAAVERIAAKGLREQEAAMGTAAGAVRRFHLAEEELGKSIGSFLLPALTSLAEQASDVFRAMTQGTEDNERALMGMAQAALKVQQFWADFHGDTKAVERLQREIDALEEQIQASMSRQVKASNDAANRMLKRQLQMLGELKSAHEHTFEKIEDIWKDAQKAMNDGGAIVGQAGPKSPAAASPFGPLNFKGEPGGKPAAQSPANRDTPIDPRNERERTQDRANRLREMARQVDEAKAAALEEKARQLDRRAKQYGEHEPAPNMAQQQVMDLSEMLQKLFTGTSNRPLRVRSDTDEKLVTWMEKITGLLQQGLIARMGP